VVDLIGRTTHMENGRNRGIYRKTARKNPGVRWPHFWRLMVEPPQHRGFSPHRGHPRLICLLVMCYVLQFIYQLCYVITRIYLPAVYNTMQSINLH